MRQRWGVETPVVAIQLNAIVTVRYRDDIPTTPY